MGVILPLDRDHALNLMDRSVWHRLAPFDGGAFPVTDPATIRMYNELQVYGSHRQVYSASHDFRIAEAACRAHPEVCDPRRLRAKVR